MNSVRDCAHGRGAAMIEGTALLKTLTRGAVAFVLTGAIPAAASAQKPATAPALLVFDGVTVVDVEHGKLVPAQRVVIAGTRIQAVGDARSVKAPEGAQIVDARGKYLIPGLWDLHVHPRRSAHQFYPLLVANGVTGIRDGGSEVPIDTLLMWRREILAGTRVGPPRQILSGQSLTNYLNNCDRRGMKNSPQTCVGDSADAVHFVDSLKAAGADMIKPRDIRPAMYFILAAQARRVGIRFGGHTWDDIALQATDSGASLIDHMRPWSGDYKITGGLRGRCWAGRETASVEQCQPAAEQFKRNNTWLVPTLTRESSGAGTAAAKSIFERFTARAAEFWGGSLLHGNWLRDSTPSGARQGAGPDTLPGALGVMRVMQGAGLPIAAGTDAGAPVLRNMPPGFALHNELAMYVAEGLTPLNALQSATLNPAKMLRATDSLGTVAPGRLADLVLLDADPLADITNTTTVRAVVANGRYFDRTALDSLLIKVQGKSP